MSDYKGKLWCEYCFVNIPRDKKTIQAHEATEKHKRNKDRELKLQYEKKGLKYQGESQMEIDKRNKELKQEKQKELKKDMKNKNKNKTSNFPSTISADKATNKFNKTDEYGGTKMTEYLQGESDPKQPFEDVWILQLDPETNHMCFYNRISGKKQFEKPFGLKLSTFEQKIWEDSEKEIKYGQPVAQIKDMISDSKVGQWETVETKDNFYNQYGCEAFDHEKIVQEESDNSEENEQMQQYFQAASDDDITDLKKDLIDKWLEDNEGKHSRATQLKLKHDKLKKLIEHNLDDVLILKKTINKPKISSDQTPIQNTFKKKLGLKQNQKNKGLFDELKDEE